MAKPKKKAVQAAKRAWHKGRRVWPGDVVQIDADEVVDWGEPVTIDGDGKVVEEEKPKRGKKGKADKAETPAEASPAPEAPASE